MKTSLILLIIIVTTIIGDYLIKIASQRPTGLTSLTFIGGAILYGLTAVGWLYLMRSHSLSAIGVFYSAATIVVLAGLGFFVFNEGFSFRDATGVFLAIAAVLIIAH